MASISKSVGARMQYMVYLVPLGDGWQGPFGGRLAPECSIWCIWCRLWRVGWVKVEVDWRRNALYIVLGAAGGRLGGSKWKPNGLVMGWASTVPSQALKPPGAPRLEATTPLVARSGFMFIGIRSMMKLHVSLFRNVIRVFTPKARNGSQNGCLMVLLLCLVKRY